jgi:hypothetical protein
VLSVGIRNSAENETRESRSILKYLTILNAQGFHSQHRRLPSLGHLELELNMHISLSLISCLLAFSLAANAVPGVDGPNSQHEVRQNILHPRTPHPGNCLSGDCLDPSIPTYCCETLHIARHGRHVPGSPQIKEMVKTCSENCRCSPSADRRTFELLCTGVPEMECCHACFCKQRYRGTDRGHLVGAGNVAGVASSSRQR